MKSLLVTLGTLLFFTLASAQAAESPFVGTWDTDWGPLTIKVDGEKFTGEYKGPKFSGKIEGKVEDGKLKVVWKQTNAEWGSAIFKISDDGKQLLGTWGGAESAINGGKWNGKRK